VSLAVGMLIADRKLTLDTRMDALFPEWRGKGARSGITVRQLLTHTSGLDPARAPVQGKETIADHALRAKLVFPPGTRFQYDNDAVDFLAVVVRRAAGKPLDAYLDERLFQKLDFVGAHWMKDPAGDPRGAGELFVRPVDLAKLGQLMLDGGKWNGEQLVPADWIARSVDAGQPFDERCGMLWWREGTFAFTVNDAVLAQWREDGLDDAAMRAARTLRSKKFGTLPEYRAAVAAAVGTGAATQIQATIDKGDHVPFFGTVADGPARGFSARGFRGQYLVVYPKSRVVAVRMRATEASDEDEGRGERHGYPAFAQDVAQIW
jgi:CubicO group peptidase (beta-lactamase class C family)